MSSSYDTADPYKPALVFTTDAEDPIHAKHVTVNHSYVYVLEGEGDSETRRYIPWHMIKEVVRGEACEVYEA